LNKLYYKNKTRLFLKIKVLIELCSKSYFINLRVYHIYRIRFNTILLKTYIILDLS